MVDNFEGWELSEAGGLAVKSLVAYDLAIAGEMTPVLRLQFVQSELELRSGKRQSLQLAMSATQARQLAADLSRMAELAEHPGAGAKN